MSMAEGPAVNCIGPSLVARTAEARRHPHTPAAVLTLDLVKVDFDANGPKEQGLQQQTAA